MSAILAAVLAVFVFTSDAPLNDYRAVAASAVAIGITIAGTDFLSLRWLGDRNKDSHYGELLRSIDEDEAQLAAPYVAAGTVSLFVVPPALAYLIFYSIAPRGLLALLLTLILFFFLYALLSFAGVTRITLGHHRRMARMRSAYEQVARQLRAQKSAPANPPPSNSANGSGSPTP